MKKILTTMFLAGSITLCVAQWQQGSHSGGPNHYPVYSGQNGHYYQNGTLIINRVSHQPLSVSVDDRLYQSDVTNSTLMYERLNSGNHKITVYEKRRNFWGKQVQHVVYNAEIYLRPEYETTISINSPGNASISERKLGNNNMNGQNGYGNNSNKGTNGKGHAYGKYKNKHHKDHDGDDDYRDNNGRDN